MVSATVEQQKIFVRTLLDNGALLVGFGDISAVGSALTDRLPVAISIILRYDDSVVDNLHADEPAFHSHLSLLSATMRKLLGLGQDLLVGWGYEATTVSSTAIKTNEQLRGLTGFPGATERAACSPGLVR